MPSASKRSSSDRLEEITMVGRELTTVSETGFMTIPPTISPAALRDNDDAISRARLRSMKLIPSASSLLTDDTTLEDDDFSIKSSGSTRSQSSRRSRRKSGASSLSEPTIRSVRRHQFSKEDWRSRKGNAPLTVMKFSPHSEHVQPKNSNWAKLRSQTPSPLTTSDDSSVISEDEQFSSRWKMDRLKEEALKKEDEIRTESSRTISIMDAEQISGATSFSGNDQAWAEFLVQLGREKARDGKLLEALSDLNDALEIQLNPDARVTKEEVAVTLNCIGVIIAHMDVEDYASNAYTAFEAMEKSLRIRQESLGPGDEKTAEAAHNMWLILHHVNEKRKQEKHKAEKNGKRKGSRSSSKILSNFRGMKVSKSRSSRKSSHRSRE